MLVMSDREVLKSVCLTEECQNEANSLWHFPFFQPLTEAEIWADAQMDVTLPVRTSLYRR